MRRTLLVGAVLMPVLASAQGAVIQAEQVWARPTPASARTAAVYLTLTDPAATDTVTGASTPVAGMAMVHETINDNGVMRMRPVQGVRLEAGKPVAFKPGGLHIMLEQLKHPLKLGDTFPLTLTFAQAAPLTVTVTVGKPGGAPSSASTVQQPAKPSDPMPGMKMNSANDE